MCCEGSLPDGECRTQSRRTVTVNPESAGSGQSARGLYRSETTGTDSVSKVWGASATGKCRRSVNAAIIQLLDDTPARLTTRHAFVAKGHLIQRTLHPRTCGESERRDMPIKNAYYSGGQYPSILFVSRTSMRISSHLLSFRFHRSCQCFRTKRVYRSALTKFDSGARSSFNVDVVYRISNFKGKQVVVVAVVLGIPSLCPSRTHNI
jgi:hypothetical protein